VLTKFSIIASLLFLTALAPAFAQDSNSQRKDPTRPPSVIIEQLAPVIEHESGLKLSAIFKRDTSLYAVINGQIFSQGDDVNGMKVEKISQHRVVLTPNAGDREQVVLSVDDAAKLNKQVSK